MKLYILQNQFSLFLNKQGEWVDGRETHTLFRSEYKDEALNQLFEAGSRDINLRIHLVECTSDNKKHPIIPSDIVICDKTTAEEIENA